VTVDPAVVVAIIGAISTVTGVALTLVAGRRRERAQVDQIVLSATAEAQKQISEQFGALLAQHRTDVQLARESSREALAEGRLSCSSSINRAMWEGRGDRGPYADTIRDVRSAMAPSPVSQTTYRRTSGKSFGLPEFASTDELRGLVGTSVQNPGFTSTTVDESVLQDHPSVVHMQIEVPRGTPSAWVHNVGLDHDGELLLDANTRYEVLSVEPMGSFETLMRVRIVP
jgi:hypothetical protein